MEIARILRDCGKTMGYLHPENVTGDNCVRVTIELQKMYTHRCELIALLLENMAGQPSPASDDSRV